MPLHAAVTVLTRTDKARWRRVAKKTPSWDERNRLIASVIPKRASVVDVGSGAMTLRRHLGPECEYQPCDVVQSSPEVLLCDFNSGIYPALTKTYDYVVCSGILEYMRDAPDFLSRIAGFGRTIILSYNPATPSETKITRLGKGWVNDFSQEELEQLFARAHFKAKVVFTRAPNEITYELTPAATPVSPHQTVP